MTNELSSQDLASIASAIDSYPESTIKGVTLANLIKHAARDVDIRQLVNVPVGPGALKKFADVFLAHLIRRVDRSQLPPETSDVIFEKIAAQAALPSGPMPSSGDAVEDDYWSAFVRVSDARKIILIDGNEPSLRLASAAAPEDAVIEGVSQLEFNKISDEYIERLRLTPVGEVLADNLKLAPTYDAFMGILKQAGAHYFMDWSRHRRDALRAIFRQRLGGHGVESAKIDALLLRLDEAQAEARKRRYQQQKEQQAKNAFAGGSHEESSAEYDEGDMRRLLKLAIDEMSMNEIRAVRIPFGAVLDALASEKNRLSK